MPPIEICCTKARTCLIIQKDALTWPLCYNSSHLRLCEVNGSSRKETDVYLAVPHTEVIEAGFLENKIQYI